MPRFRTFTGANRTISVEVEDLGGTIANTGEIATLVQPIVEVMNLVSAQMATVQKEAKPSELEVRFGITAVSDGKIAITLGGNSNLQVRLKWGATSSSPFDSLIPQLPK